MSGAVSDPIRLVLFAGVLTFALAGCAPQKGDQSGSSASTGAPSSGGQTAFAGEEIPVGEYASLTGGQAGFGQTTHNGMSMAIDEINASGGVNGKKLKLYTEDDESNADKVKTVVTKLITQNKVVAVLGEVASSRSITAAPVCEQYGVPMISPSSTNPDVTVNKTTGKVREKIFRVCFIDPFQGHAMAKFMREKLKVQRVAVFRDVKQDYSKGLADFFVKTFTEKGGSIVKDVSYSTGDTDFRAQLTAIKAANPQAVFIPGYYGEVGPMAKQARELGLTVPLAGGDGWDDPKVVEVGGKAIEGCYITNHYSVDSQDPVSKTFVDNYKKKYGQGPNALAALGYDTAMLLKDAITRAKSTDGVSLTKAIAETKGLPGVTGNVTFDASHNNSGKPAVILQYRGGKQVLVDTVQP